MSKLFHFETTVAPDWIDYNGHMRDSSYSLVFSLAVDAFQDDVGFDATYRRTTGCTIYLLEDHKFFLREVKEGAHIRVETQVIGLDAKRFHLHMRLFDGEQLAAVGEFMELHVNQRPEPHATPIPQGIFTQLEAAVLGEQERQLSRTARADFHLTANRSPRITSSVMLACPPAEPDLLNRREAT